MLVTEKSESLKIENNVVACCLYVTFSSFYVLYNFLVSFRRFSERMTKEIKINEKDETITK